MLLLKYLLLSAGIAMFVIAAGILSYDAYLLIAWQRRRSNLDPEAGAPGLSPVQSPLAHLGCAGDAGLGSALDLGGHRDRPQRNGRRARKPDQGHAGGNSISGRALRDAAGRARRTVQHARPVVHHRHQRRFARQRRGERRSVECASPARPSPARPGKRRTHPGPRHHRPLPD